AVSTPVVSIWADPRHMRPASVSFQRLAEELGVPLAGLGQRLGGLSEDQVIALSARLSNELTAAALAAEPAEQRAQERAVRAEAGMIVAFVGLARDLGMGAAQLHECLELYKAKRFMYLARHLMPSDAEKVLANQAPGVYGQQEYKRFYPAGEVTAQLVGYTNIDDQGQEGIELAFEKNLAGRPGSRTVLKDRNGQVIKEIGLVESERSGKDIALSIDLRLQYLAYRELKAAVNRFQAASGSLVMLDAETGEVLAMVNQPSYNPNNRVGMDIAGLRNRAMTDIVEPGSTMKPLTVAAALESGKYTAESVFETHPGYIWVAGKTFADHSNYGTLDMTGVLRKSSQVATTQMALELDPNMVRDMFSRFGMGDA